MCIVLSFCLGLSWAFYCCDKNARSKNNLGRNGFMWFTYPGSQSMKEARTGLRQEPRVKRPKRSHGGALLIRLLPMVCPACFLTRSRTICSGMVPPTVGWSLLHPSLIKNIPYRPAYSPILWRHFFQLSFILSRHI